MGSLWLAKGKIEVKDVKGYWFTSGGEKGSFGFYPHLKDGNLPVYPDTQIHGDLRMAVSWLLSLKRSDNNALKKYFGDSPDLTKDRHDSASCIFITDLKPVDDNFQFSVKPKTEIDESRTNKKHMLVNLEYAYFNNATLCADIYLGYFKEQDELNSAKELISEAVQLLSGFGAFRSRGYGRGRVEVNWEKEDRCINPASLTNNGSKKEFLIFLKSLVNFRNKQIDPGKRQLLDSIKYISSAQFRSWFIKTYKDVFDEWPTTAEMSSIQFTDFYPSEYDEKNGKGLLGYPAPMSTVKFQNNDIEDIWNISKEKDEKQGKPKPLSSNNFITEDINHIVELKTNKRMRNSTNPNFSTKKEGGLFAQEFIKAGTVFGGRVKLSEQESEFGKRAFAILSNNDLLPIINGAIFKKYQTEKSSKESVSDDKPYLVVSAFACDSSVWGMIFGNHEYIASDDNTARRIATPQIAIATQQRYNRELKRPRRNRIVVAPGSILLEDKGCLTLQWRGFGELKIPSKNSEPGENKTSQICAAPDSIPKMSRSQAGQLMEFLSPIMNKDLMEKIIDERLNKYDKWTKAKDEFKINDELIPKEVLNNLKTKLKETDGLKKAQEYIQDLLDRYKLTQWEKNRDRILKKFKELAKQKGYQDE